MQQNIGVSSGMREMATILLSEDRRMEMWLNNAEELISRAAIQTTFKRLLKWPRSLAPQIQGTR